MTAATSELALCMSCMCALAGISRAAQQTSSKFLLYHTSALSDERWTSTHLPVMYRLTCWLCAGDADECHPCIGYARRLMVPRREQQADILVQAVQNHNPDVIIVDEIGTTKVGICTTRQEVTDKLSCAPTNGLAALGLLHCYMDLGSSINGFCSDGFYSNDGILHGVWTWIHCTACGSHAQCTPAARKSATRRSRFNRRLRWPVTVTLV
jgi:hypothetical protein